MAMADALERLKVLIDSSTPIIVMETVEEVHAVREEEIQALKEWAADAGRAGLGGGRAGEGA